MKQKRIDMRGMLSLYILAVCIISFGCLGIISYFTVGLVMTEQCKKDAMSFASFAASEIDGDKYASITSDEDEYYAQVYETLSKYTSSDLVKYIYSMNIDDKNVLRFIVDTDEVDPAEYGEEYPMADDMIAAFNGEASCDKKIQHDEWGSFFSAYAPIIDSDNNVVGIVGCDIEITYIEKIKLRIAQLIVVILSVFGAAYFIIYNRLSANMVRYDYLTGLANYDGLVEKGKQLEKLGKIGEYTAILLNIKDFKYLNQKIGVNGGDIVLKEYSSKLRSMLSRKDFVSRTGSDNFMILICDERVDDFLAGLSNIKIAFDSKNDKLTQINVRGGIYSAKPNDTIKEIMNYASLALKESRVSTASDFILFEDEMINVMLEEKKIITDYKKAIENKEFVVYYQPKVNTEDYKLCGAEALVRWKKDGKMIPPGKFVPVLEKERRIAELDFYVFESVCRDISEWLKAGIEPCKISSNFSKVHLANPNFSNDVMSIVKKYKIDHKYLEIELTESSGYSDYDALTRFVNRMNNENISTSIDDFGTGFSSLSLLKNIDVDVVKIDKSFLAKSTNEDEKQEKMLENIIQMINDLDKTVICEGVETEEQLDFLKNAECSIIQGYFFDKPLPKEEFEQRLKNPDYTK